MAKEIFYKGHKIIKYGPTTFLATCHKEWESADTKNTSLKRTLEDAQKWIDKKIN